MRPAARFTLTLLLTVSAPVVAGSEALPNLILPGDPALTGTRLEPYQARYSERAGGEVVGSRIVLLQEALFPEGRGFKYVQTLLRGGTVYDEVQFLADSLRPVMRIVSSLSILHQMEVISGSAMRGVRIAADGSRPEPLAVAIDGDRFAGGPHPGALATLPLAPGYVATFPVFSTDMGLEGASSIFQRVEVLDREEISAGEGESYDCWVVDARFVDSSGAPIVPSGKSWIAARPPYLVRSDRLELVSVR